MLESRCQSDLQETSCSEKGYLREIFAVAIGWEGLKDVLKVWL